MKINLEIGPNELGIDLFDQIVVSRLRDIQSMCSKTCWHHPDDKKQDKKIIKACGVLLEYFGEE